MIKQMNRLLLTATAIDGYSGELAQIQPPAYSPLKPNQKEGRVRIAMFSKTFASEAAGLDLALCEIPEKARILYGEFCVSSSLGGTTTVSIGLAAKDGSGFLDKANSVSDAVANLYPATAITSTGLQRISGTISTQFLYETEKPLFLTLTTAAAAMGTQVLRGYISYVVD